MAPVVALSILQLNPRWSPRWGVHGACSLWARSCGPSRTLSPLPLHPAALSSGGGPRSATVIPHPRGAGGVWGGGGGRPCRLSFVARMHDASTTQVRSEALDGSGGGGFLLWGPHTPEVGYLTSVSCGPMSPRPPPVRRGIGPCLLAFFPGHVGLLCSLLFFFPSPQPAARLSPWRVGMSSAPPPMSPRRLLAVLAPFQGGWGRRGWGGGRPRCPSSGVSTSQARRRHEARHLSLCQGGGGLAVWLPSSPFLPCVRTPGAPPAGACTARASSGHGRVVRPAPSLRCLPTLPLCPRGGGGGGRCPPLPTFIPHPWGGGGVCGGGGLVVFPSLHACRRHDASTAQARGAAPVPLQGGGHALWLPSSPFLPCVRTPSGPPAGACTARALYGHGRVVRPAPSRRCLPSLPLCPRGGGGGALFAPPYLHPPPLGGRRCVWGGGALVVFPS